MAQLKSHKVGGEADWGEETWVLVLQDFPWYLLYRDSSAWALAELHSFCFSAKMKKQSFLIIMIAEVLSFPISRVKTVRLACLRHLSEHLLGELTSVFLSDLSFPFCKMRAEIR